MWEERGEGGKKREEGKEEGGGERREGVENRRELVYIYRIVLYFAGL